MVFDAQRKSSGRYIKIGLGSGSHVDVVEAFKHNYLGIKDFVRSSNMTFPLPIGKYCIKNATIDTTRAPPLIPAGEYILEQNFIANDINATTIYVYETVVYPPLYSGPN